MEIGDVDILLDVLGNTTRRRILQILADEPRYFIQLSKELGVSQQAVLKHLEILEKYGFITSYGSESTLGAPKRKYYELNKSCMLAIGITRDAVEFVFHEIPQHVGEDEIEERELRTILREVAGLERESNAVKILNASDRILKEINSQLEELSEKEMVLLRMKQRITKIAHQTIRDSFEEELHRQILYSTIGEQKVLDVDDLSALLDTREKEISAALKILKQRLEK